MLSDSVPRANTSSSCQPEDGLVLPVVATPCRNGCILLADIADHTVLLRHRKVMPCDEHRAGPLLPALPDHLDCSFAYG